MCGRGLLRPVSDGRREMSISVVTVGLPALMSGVLCVMVFFLRHIISV